MRLNLSNKEARRHAKDTLFYLIYVPNELEHIKSMTPEEIIWKSQPEFQKYPLKDFKTYNKSMKS